MEKEFMRLCPVTATILCMQCGVHILNDAEGMKNLLKSPPPRSCGGDCGSRTP
jgi:hypothetical protein